VRHPLYSCILVLFWTNPAMTADQLLLSVMWTAWIWVGAMLEERDLLAEFGESYGAYRRQVPMLIPWRGRVTLSQEVAPSGSGPGAGMPTAAPPPPPAVSASGSR
jgi:hypothetical protein